MLGASGYCASSSPLDGEVDGDGASSRSSSDVEGPAAAAVAMAAAGVRLSPTGTEDDVGWTNIGATHLSYVISSSCPEARATTGEQADADCPPSAPCSSTVANESDAPGAELGAATSDQRSSALQRRGSLDWTALEAAAKKSSTSASAGCDATGKLLQITETLGVVRHNVKQVRSPTAVGYSPDRSVTLPPRPAHRHPLDFHSLKQKLEKLMTSSGTVVSDQKVTPKDSKCSQVRPAAAADGVASGTERVGDGASAARLVAGAAPTTPIFGIHPPQHHHHHHHRPQRQQQPSSLTATTPWSAGYDSNAASQTPVELRHFVEFVLRTSPLARLLTSYIMVQALQCDFQLQMLLLRHRQERLQLAMRHTQEMMAAQTIIQSVSPVSSPSPAAATQSWLDAVTLYTLTQLQCLLPNLSSPAVNPQGLPGGVTALSPVWTQWPGASTPARHSLSFDCHPQRLTAAANGVATL